MIPPKLVFDPPKKMHILSVVQVMITHPTTKTTSTLKCDIMRLNKKLQKLQREGMFIVGIFFTEIEPPVQMNLPL